MNQKVLEMGDQLVALTVFAWALCDVVLDAGPWIAQWALHLDKARLPVALLEISTSTMNRFCY